MNDYKFLLGASAAVISVISYFIYLYSIYRGQTKPHGFTWFIWGVINIVAFAAVLVSGGSSGGWVLGINILGCFTIAGIAFYQKRVDYDRMDWLALGGAFLAIFFWWLTDNPLYAVILVSLSDTIAIIPSLRKAYRLPFEENANSFIFGVSYYILALFALETFSLTTSLYHFAIIAADLAIVGIVLVRRKQLSEQKTAV